MVQSSHQTDARGSDERARLNAASDFRRSVIEAGIAAAVVLVIVIVAVSSLWRVADDIDQERMRTEMARLATSLTWTIDPELHQQLNSPEQLDSDLYARAIAMLRNARRSTPGVKYMYTAVADGDKVRFVLYAADPGDHDGDGREDRAGVWEEYEDAEPAMLLALGDGKTPGHSTASPEPYTDEWGTFVTGYAPLMNAAGKQIGVIGVDMDAGDYQASCAKRRRAALLGLVPGTALAGGVGFGAFLLRRRQLRNLREAEAASYEAAESAAMLAESEGRFRLLADAMPVLIWTSDESGRCDYVNRGWVDFTGRDREREYGEGWLESVQLEDRHRVAAEFGAAFAARGPFESEFQMRRADGASRSMLSRGTPRVNPSGEFSGFAGVCLDVTEQREAEATVRTSESRLRAVLDTALDAVISLDEAGRITDWNPQAERLFGYASGDAKGRVLSELVLPPDAEQPPGLFRSLANAQQQGAGERAELAIQHADGRRLIVEVSCSSTQAERGKGVSLFARDISDRKHAELAQQAALRLSMRLARASSVEEASRAVNDSLENMTGFTRSAILLFDQSGSCRFVGWRGISREYRAAVDGHCPWRYGQSEADPIVVHDVQCDESLAAYRELFDRERIRTLAFVPVRTEAGVLGKLMLYGDTVGDMTTRVVDSARTAATYLGVAVGRLRAQERTRTSEQLFRLLVENTDDLVDLQGEDGTSQYIGPGFTRLLGVEPQPQNRGAIGSHVAAEDASAYAAAQDAVRRGGREKLECRLVRHNGERLWVDLHMVPVFDDAGSRVVRILHSGRDITERKAFENALAGARVAAEAASRAKTEFLANMSHEIRTPLTAILGYTDVLAEDAASSTRTETVQTIRRAGEHLLSVVNDILDISKIEAGAMRVERVETPVPQIISAVCQMMRPRAESKGIRFEASLTSPIPDRISSDPTRLRQILLNLVGNAVKFTVQGGVRVVAGFEPVGGRGTLTIDVIDTGPGIEREQADRLFQPFSQADASVTRKHGGTGLGLTICRRLAHLLGGEVTLARSQPGEGSCFRLEIDVEPIPGWAGVSVLESASSTPAAAPTVAEFPLKGRILVAEDGLDNQRLIRLHLTKAGGSVDVAENGRVALELIRAAESSGRPYDLLVTDMQMPEMDGYTLASTLRASGSRLPIVALTAHALAEDRQRCMDAGCDDYASKPLDRRQLLATCAKWLGRGDGIRTAA
ncbi:MAG: PAS domain S-box protein [Phycisphaerales bacterium]